MLKKRQVYLGFSIVTSIMLAIDFLLFGRMGIYVDEYGTSPTTVWGSEFWNYLSWILLLLIFVLCVVSIILTVTTNKEE